MLSVNNLSVEFSAKPLFNNVSFTINPQEKIALVGKNGAGKTTLLKILAGLQGAGNGVVVKKNDLTIGYLPQEMKVSDTTTLYEETKKAFSHIDSLKKELDTLNQKIADAQDFESEEYTALLLRAEELYHTLDMVSSSSIEGDIEKTLIGLGFKRSDFDRPTAEFSGGWRMRIELAKILLKNPDLLLLDEPTNHLDIESIQWLEQFLKTKANAVMLVSHDRAFLDNVTGRTIEISCGKIYDYKVSYTPFEQLRKERIEQQLRAYNNQQELIAETRQFIERFRYQATKAVQVQSRIKQLEKIVPVEVDEVDNSRLRLRFPPAPRSGDYPVIAENVAKFYGDHKVFENTEFTLKRGEKIAFVGKNGEGKSTLVKCIMNDIPFDGNIKIGHNVKIGYFAQNQAQLLDENLTVFDTIDHVATGEIRTRINDILGAFMFGGEASEKKVKVLSGGEKSRLAMIKLLLEPVNLLILDEPTNHLDMKSKEILKEAIADFDGTVIVVSHDRNFLDGLVDKVFEFRDGKVIENLGGIYDFLRKKNLDSLSELERNRKVAETPGNIDKDNKAEEKKKAVLSYQEKKEKDRMTKRTADKIKKLEEEIALIETAISDMENKFASGISNPALLKEYDEAKQNLETNMQEWENKQSELENLLNS